MVNLYYKHFHTMDMFYYINQKKRFIKLIQNCFASWQSKQNDTDSILYKNGIGQYDTNNNLIREFICKYDCIKQLQMSDKTLTKALTKNTPYNGTYFKDIGSKLKLL